MIVLPGPADLYRASKLQRGHLSQVPFPLLLRALHQHRRSVAVDLRHGDILKTVTLRSGVLVACESNQPREWIGAVVRDHGRISERELEGLLGEAAGRGVPLGQVLLGRGLVSDEELERFLRQGLAGKLLEVFGWDDGVFTLRPVWQTQEPLGVLKIERLILTGILRFTSERAIAAFRRRVGGEAVGLAPAVAPRSRLLEPAARQLIEALDEGPCTLDELVAATALPASDVAKLTYALGLLGLVGTVGELTAGGCEAEANDTQQLDGMAASGPVAAAGPSSVHGKANSSAAPANCWALMKSGSEPVAPAEQASRVRLLEDMRLRGVSLLGFELRREERRGESSYQPPNRAPGLRYLDV